MATTTAKERTLHFTVGEDIGDIVNGIAREKLICDFNPQKALDTYTGSFVGMGEDFAKKLLIGEYDIRAVDGGNGIEVDRHVPGNNDFYLYERIESLVRQIREDAEQYLAGLRNLVCNFDGEIRVTLDMSEFMECVYDEEGIDLDCLDEVRFMRSLRRFIERSIRCLDMVRWCSDTYGEDEIPSLWAKIPTDLLRIMNEIEMMRIGQTTFKTEMARQLYFDNAVQEFLDANTDNERRLVATEGLRPVPADDRDNDGGYLSPQGEFYALKGMKCNFIHMAIADNFRAHGRIPKDCENPERWLEEHGWIKIHYDHVMFLPRTSDDVPQFATDEQVRFLKEYAHARYDGVLRFGFMMEKCRAYEFGSMDKFAFNELF